jgi:formate dehydrogenase maturation protein FdhE
MSKQCPECFAAVGNKQERCNLCDTVLPKAGMTFAKRIIPEPIEPKQAELIKKHKERIAELKEQYPDDWHDRVLLSIQDKIQKTILNTKQNKSDQHVKLQEIRNKINAERVDRGGCDSSVLNCMPP